MTSPRRYSTPNVPSDAQPSESGLLGPIEVHAICQALGVRPTKTLGQNFVHDAGTVRRIVRDAGIGEGTQVIEVGPGLGSLTLGLLEARAQVRAIEIDPMLARALPVTVAQRMPEAAERLHVINRDAVQINGLEDFEDEWPAPTHLVANLPYNVAVPLLLSMLESFPSLESALVMVQAEVADRLAAQPGSRTYGVPSVKAAWYGTATLDARYSGLFPTWIPRWWSFGVRKPRAGMHPCVLRLSRSAILHFLSAGRPCALL